MAIRHLLAMIVALIMCISSYAFLTEDYASETNRQLNYGTFTVVAEGINGTCFNQTIMYDPDTMVMYTYLDGRYAGTMTVLYNADGTLKLYSPDTQYVTFSIVNEGNNSANFDQIVMYDPDTMVMYTYLDGRFAGALSVLYNADGTLKTFSPEY